MFRLRATLFVPLCCSPSQPAGTQIRSLFLNRQRFSFSASEPLASPSVGGGGRPAPGETARGLKT
jgi:hypothetical protein